MALTPEQNRDEIIAMALVAGMSANIGYTEASGEHFPAVAALKTSVPVQWLERFAQLVAAKAVAVPLTAAQIKDLHDDGVFLGTCRQIVRAIEAEHGIKGGGEC